MTISRRTLLAGAAACRARAAYPFRLAVCNETFAGMTFADGCNAARNCGYSGIEIAPATLDGRGDGRELIAAKGLTFVGLHSLLSAPKGLHVTTPDRAVRERSWEHVRRLIDVCAGLGPNGVMVFGSGKQRAATGGSSAADARKRFEDGLASVAPEAAAGGVTILVEPLAPRSTDVVNTLEEAIGMVRRIGHLSVRTMFDTHNTVAETEPHAELIRLYHPYIRHVHVNEMDGRYPGTGAYDFAAVFDALAECSYQGWVSLEVFDFRPDGVTIARNAAGYLRRQMR